MSLLIFTAGYDHTIRFWEALSGICSRTIQHPGSQVNRLCITPDKRFLAAAGSDSVKLYDLRSSNPIPVVTFKGHKSNVTGVAFHCEGKWMVTSSEDCTVKVWDTRDAKVQRSYVHPFPVNDVVIHPNQGELISCDRGGVVRIWDLGENKCVNDMAPDGEVSVTSVTVANDGSMLAAGNNNVSLLAHTLVFTTDSLSGKRLHLASDPNQRHNAAGPRHQLLCPCNIHHPCPPFSGRSPPCDVFSRPQCPDLGG